MLKLQPLSYEPQKPGPSRLERFARWFANEVWIYAWTLVTIAGSIAVALYLPAMGWGVFLSVAAFLAVMIGLQVLISRLFRSLD